MPTSPKNSNLDLFWKLSDSKEKIRIDSAFKVVSNLHRQKRQNDEGFQENFDYSLQRFVSALASDRISSRRGYFIGLVQLLKMFPEEANVAKIMERMNTHLSGKGSKSVSVFLFKFEVLI